MVQIVKLADRGEACFQHFDIREGSDRLDLIGREAIEKPVHHLAPGPKAVGCRPAALGEPGHPALEGVAVEIGQAGNGDARHQLGAVAACVRADRADRTVGDRHSNVASPARRQQRVVEKQLA